MPRKQTLKGAGITDLINNAREYLRELSSDIPTKLNNISSQTLNQYGNNAIQNITIMRSPLKSHWTNSLNVLSMGKFDELKEAYGFDKLYHLSLIVQAGETIIIEKNEVVKIAKFDQNNISNQADFLNVPLMVGVVSGHDATRPSKTITLNEMINNTKALMGDTLFYDYDALRGNNCQNFVLSLLSSVGLLDQQTYDFIYQDISGITNDLINSEHSYVPDVTQVITRLGSKISRLIGKGKKAKINKTTLNFIQRNGFAFL